VHGAQDLSFTTDHLITQMIERFHQLHFAQYGHARDAEAPEITGVRLIAATEIPQPHFSGGFTAQRRTAVPVKQRRANLGQGFCATDIYRGADLAPGHYLAGPAIIEEAFTTIVVYPGWNARLDDAGDYELTRQTDL
jgi:N-methylhydantoinase A